MFWVRVLVLPVAEQLQISYQRGNLANLEQLLLYYLQWRTQLKELVAIWLQGRMVLMFLNLVTIPEILNDAFSNRFTPQHVYKYEVKNTENLNLQNCCCNPDLYSFINVF